MSQRERERVRRETRGILLITRPGSIFNREYPLFTGDLTVARPWKFVAQRLGILAAAGEEEARELRRKIPTRDSRKISYISYMLADVRATKSRGRPARYLRVCRADFYFSGEMKIVVCRGRDAYSARGEVYSAWSF